MVVCVTFINNFKNVFVKQHLLNILQKVEQPSFISGTASNGGSLLFQVMILFQGAIFENFICSVFATKFNTDCECGADIIASEHRSMI